MLNIVCINAGNYCGKGAEYVNVLFDMVRRNLSDKQSFRFICFTDNAEGLDDGIQARELPGHLEGWWNKLWLFCNGVFEAGERVLYFDLDTVIVGGLDGIIKYNGEFAILEDFYRPGGLQSSVMVWKAGNKTSKIWTEWNKAGRPCIEGGDQAWIERVNINADILQDLYPAQFASYKISCRNLFPKHAKVIVFHGKPRPHEVISGWVPKVWAIGGGTSLEFEIVCNTENNELIRNIKYACTLSHKWLLGEHEVHDDHAVIVGGGPSLKKQINEIKQRKANGQKIFSTNNTWNYLMDNGVRPDYHVMSDARMDNAAFVPKYAECLYASQVHPAVFEKAQENCNDIMIWHPMHEGIGEVIGPDERNYAVIGCGSTTGLKTIGIAFIMGYRNMHLYGFDSSYEEGAHHAYKQELNDSSKVIEVMVNGVKFSTSPWMVTQVDEFKELASILVAEENCLITVHGYGLLPYVASIMSKPAIEDTDAVEIDGLWWPSQDMNCRKAAMREVGDLDRIMAYCKKRDTVVQAGGNVGVWPLKLSESFGEVITFEPDLLNYQCLAMNAGRTANIFAFNAALGDEIGKASLEKQASNAGAHYIKDGDDFPVMTIDTMPFKSCDLIQLDIEGYELKALKGALNTIIKFRPVIVIEDKGLDKRYSGGKASDWLYFHGYRLVERINNDAVFLPDKVA